MFLSAVRLFYRFDPWHSVAAFACRPYKRKVAELASSVNASLAVEVGCGLGGIICRTRSHQRIGLDSDLRAVRAARLLNGHKTRFEQASLFDPERIAKAVGAGPIDVLIAVNWLDGLSIDQIEAALRELRKRIAVRRLLIDEIAAGGSSHRHDPDALKRLGEVISSVHDEYDERTLHLVALG